MSSPEQMFEEAKAGPTDELLLRIERDPTPGMTFSPDKLEELVDAMRVFMLARIASRFDPDKPDAPGVSEMEVELRLTLDGTRKQVMPAEQPWFVVDGASRKDGVRRMLGILNDRQTEVDATIARIDSAFRKAPDIVVANAGRLLLEEARRRGIDLG